ncbi:MAG: pyrroline-5-carboxylate reductase [Phycisphaeraceae bacterium]|nr:MAG: pyrroline-5-carboxylate reductase [Phycisphaeraceae bacterium]
MAEAIVGGCLRSGAVAAGVWMVAEPDGAKRARFAGMGAGVFGSAAEMVGAMGAEDAVLLAVKPQSLAGLGGEVGGKLGGRLVISILAGMTIGKVDAVLGCGGRVVRAMPNTPARIGLGITAVCGGAGVREGDLAAAERVFGGVGETVRLDEEQMDAFTAVAGSGPAYVFLLTEWMVRAGEEAGLERDVALESARRTVIGAAGLLGEDADPAVLRGAVTSKGGTTAAALEVLEGGGFGALVVRAVLAARDRGRALSGEV